MTPSEIAAKLREAARLLQKTGWCKGAYVRGKSGRILGVDSRSAAQFCLVGAIRRVAPYETAELTRAVSRYLGGVEVTRWNDEQESAKPVIAALRGAAKAVEETQ